MLNLFQHPACYVFTWQVYTKQVYTKQAVCPVGCRNKFGMT